MPWENTEQHIRSGHRDPEEFQKDTLKTITLNEKEGIKAVVGKPKSKDTMEAQSYLFEKDKGWTVEKAKTWFEKHHNPAKEHVYAVLPFTITEKIMEKPLRIRGLAMTTGMSRNFDIYTPVIDVLRYIAESADKAGVIGFDFRVAPDAKFEFFPQNSKASAVSLSEKIEQSEYGMDIHRVRNRIVVYGVADKSVPLDKAAWTESLTPADGVWTATSGTVSFDGTVKVKGSGSVKTSAQNLSYGGCLFTINAGKEVDAELYPVLNLWLNRESSFNGNVTLTLFDTADHIADREFTVGHEKWFQTQVRVGAANADLWQVESGFDWTQVKKVRVVCWFDAVSTGSFWVDGLFFGGRRYSALQEDAGSQSSYGLRELVEVDEELWSDDECTSRANALLASLKDSAEQLTLRSTVVDYGTTPLLPGDTVHIVLPNEGVDGDFRILSAEYKVDAKTQVLETVMELGREKPLLADYMFRLKSKTDSLSRYKLARV